MTAYTNRLLRLVCIIAGRNTDQCAAVLGTSRAGVKRMVRDLRDLGVVIRATQWHAGRDMGSCYIVQDYGPFNVQVLRQTRLPVLPSALRFRGGGRTAAGRRSVEARV